MDVLIQAARPVDLSFLRQMLYEAAIWRPGQTRPPIDVALAEPKLAKLLADWGKDGDVGVIAMTPDTKPVGAAWYRFWSDSNHSYGYIDSTIPEVAIGVVNDRRGEGIGTALLDALIARARSENITALSLSVERENPALRLYKRTGFEIVGAEGNA